MKKRSLGLCGLDPVKKYKNIPFAEVRIESWMLKNGLIIHICATPLIQIQDRELIWIEREHFTKYGLN